MFYENRLVNLNSSEIAQVANPSSSAEERTNVLNDKETTGEWADERQEAASKEVKAPITSIAKDTKSKALELIKLPKTIFGKIAQWANNTIANLLAIPPNLGRWALDATVRTATRPIVAVSDLLPEKTFGTVSRLINSTREKIDGVIGDIFLDAHGAHAAAH